MNETTSWSAKTESLDGINHPQLRSQSFTDQPYLTVHQWDGVSSVCETIVNAVSAYLAVDPLELQPIGEVIDPDAVNELFGPTNHLPGTDRSTGYLTFHYSGCEITLFASGQIEVS